MLHLRPYLEADAPAMVPLMSELGYPTTEQEIAARIARMPAGSHHTLVAETSGSVVGFIGLAILPVYEHPHPIGLIIAMAVDPGHQGRGIGKALLAAAEAHFRDRGVTDCRVNSGLQRLDAHRFYEANGYDKTGYRLRKLLP